MADRSSGSPILKTNPSEWGGLTKKQREANRLLGGEQRHTLLVGGASSGKTFTVVRRIMARGLRARIASRYPALSLECSAGAMSGKPGQFRTLPLAAQRPPAQTTRCLI